MNVDLTRREQKLIRRIMQLQIEAIKEILSNAIEDTDIELYCLEKGIDKREMIRYAERDMDTFENIAINPGLFLTMDSRDLSILIHIMENEIPNKQFKYTKRKIWYKINLFQKYPINYN